MQPPHLELDDLVRMRDGALAFVERLPGDSDSDSDPESDDDDDSITDTRGRLTRWVRQLSFSPPAHPAPADRPPARALISAYDDDPRTPAADDHADDLPPDPRLRPHPHRGPLPDAAALVTLALSGHRHVVPGPALTPVDRSFDPGAIVARLSSRRAAVVERVAKTLHVRRVAHITPATARRPDPATVFDVPARELGFFSGLRSGDTVVRGNWVGVVDYFQEDVYVQFADGAIACVPGHHKALRNVDPRTPDRTKTDPFAEGLYYPGQRVASLPEVWRTIALWIRGAYTGLDHGVVKSVKVGDVGVEWVAKNMYANDGEDPPAVDDEERGVENVNFSDLTPLEAFRNIWWTVGDRGYLTRPIPPNDRPTHPPLANGERHHGRLEHHDDADDDDDNNDNDKDDKDGDDDDDDDDDDDGEWEEDEPDAQEQQELQETIARRRRGGRLMKATRRARELTSVSSEGGVVTDVSLANPSANPDDVVQVVGTKTTLDVLWQDGTRSQGVSALDFRRNDHPDAHDFFPGEIVTRADDDVADDENGNPSPLKRRGALVRMNQSERTALVRWQNETTYKFEEEEEVSVYELKGDEFEASVGDTVLHAPSGAVSDTRKEWVGVVTGLKGGNCTVAWYGGKVTDVPFTELVFLNNEDDDGYESAASTTEMENDADGFPWYSGQGHANGHGNSELAHNWGPDEDDASEALFHGFAEGRVTIARIVDDHVKSKLFSLSFEDESVTRAIQMAVETAAEALETRRARIRGEDGDQRITCEDARLLAGILATRATSELVTSSLVGPATERTDPFHGSEAADSWGRFSKALYVAFESLLSGMKSKAAAERSAEGEQPKENGEVDHAPTSSDNESRMEDDHGRENGEIDTLERDAEDDVVGSDGADDEPSAMERFEMCDELKDFHNFSNVPSSSSASVGFLSVVNREWRRLKKSLPPGIIVRASENQNDRLRAAIIGPEDTPYADIMFIFDILMGQKYPMEPPHVWFHSHGRRLNPNLYEDGKVCLSILGTWDGDDVESWDPKTSNLLRVLLSLQALVFVEEPYYNEAGYQKQIGTEEGEANSRIYNESAFLLSIKHMLATLRTGGAPEDCGKLAVEHYRLVGPRILNRCRLLAKADGSVGLETEGEEANSSTTGEKQYSSSGFRRSLSQLIPSLEKAIESLKEGKTDEC